MDQIVAIEGLKASGISMTLPKIRACLFDMDGLLINSEDLITACIDEVLAEYGKPQLPWSIKTQLQGRTLNEASKILLAWSELPLSMEDYQSKLKNLHTTRFPTCQPLPGVEKLLKTLSTAKDLQLALATSSSREKFDLKTSHLTGLFSVFPNERRVLGDDPRIPSGRHKPAPDIYLLALKCINETLQPGVQPLTAQECLVFEDAVQGVEAGRAAGMHVVWVPHAGLLKELNGREDSVIRGLPVSNSDNSDGPAWDIGTDGGPADGNPQQGSVRLLTTLEHFDYSAYGIEV